MDDLLRQLERQFKQGDYGAGGRLVIERLRLGQHEGMSQPDVDSWVRAWESNNPGSELDASEDVDLDESPPLEAFTKSNTRTDGSEYSWTEHRPSQHWTPLVGWAQNEEYAGTNCVWVGKLSDGRWFYASGGCDSTGWDCQSWLSWFVCTDPMSLAKHINTDDVRRLLEVS